jgi:hypothetical protein
MENGYKASGLMIAPKVFTIIHGMELGKPIVPPTIMGISFVRSDDSAEGKGYDKKRTPVRNRLDRGLKMPQPEKTLTYQRYFIVRMKGNL